MRAKLGGGSAWRTGGNSATSLRPLHSGNVCLIKSAEKDTGANMSKFVSILFLFLCSSILALSLSTTLAFADECDRVARSSLPIVAPPADAGSAANFSGVWSGIWILQKGMKSRNTGSDRHPLTYCGQLHVSVKGSRSATVSYCVSGLPEIGLVANCSTEEAAISGNQITFTSPRNYAYSFTLQGGGTLNAQYQGKRGQTIPYVTEFHKIE
jgi:hypothetical protein